MRSHQIQFASFGTVFETSTTLSGYLHRQKRIWLHSVVLWTALCSLVILLTWVKMAVFDLKLGLIVIRNVFPCGKEHLSLCRWKDRITRCVQTPSIHWNRRYTRITITIEVKKKKKDKEVNVHTVVKTNVKIVCEHFDSTWDIRFPAVASSPEH